VDACGQEGETFQHALYVGVLALIRFELEAGGDLRVTFGKLEGQFPDVSQLAFVVLEEVVTHGGLQRLSGAFYTNGK